MDVLSGQDIRVILNIKQGRGFGHLNVISTDGIFIEAALNGRVLDTDVVPFTEEPLFDTELMWESDKKSLRRLRAGGTAIKIQCFTVGQLQMKRDPVGHVIINVRQAHVAPSGISHAVIDESWWQWQKIIGARPPSPELLCCLRLEERPEMLENHIPQHVKESNFKYNEHAQASCNLNLITRLHADKGIIQIGSDETALDRFILIIYVGQAVNLDLLIPGNYTKTTATENEQLYFHYSILDYAINTAKISMDDIYRPISLNEKMVISLCSSLENLEEYFSASSKLRMKLMIGNDEIGFTEMTLQGLIPSTNKTTFCSVSTDNTVTIESPCFLRGFKTREIPTTPSGLKPYINLRAKLKYQELEHKNVAQSETQNMTVEMESTLHRSSSYTVLDVPVQSNYNVPTIDTEHNSSNNNNNKASGEQISIWHQNVGNLGEIASNDVHSSNLKKTSENRTEEINFITEVPGPDKKLIIATGSHLEVPCTQKVNEYYHSGVTLRDNTTQAPDGCDKPRHLYTLNIALESVIFEHLPPRRRYYFRFHHPNAEIICSSHPEIVIQEVQKNINLQNIKCRLRFISAPEEINRLLLAWPPKINICDTLEGQTEHLASAALNIGPLLEKEMRQCCCDVQLIDVRTLEKFGVLTVTMALEDNGQQLENKMCHDIRSEQDLGSAVVDSQLAYRVIEEIEDWKERQKELFRAQLKKKEQVHNSALCKKWNARRTELEKNLYCSVEQCKLLAQSLSDTTEELRLKVYENAGKEKELSKYKYVMEQQNKLKIMELKEATRRVQDDLSVQVVKLEREKNELKESIKELEKEKTLLKEMAKSLECDLDNLKKTSLTKDQVASLLQELKSTEEKLESEMKSKSFFKEQWARAVREIHRIKSEQQEAIQFQIKHNKEELESLSLQHLLSENKNEVREDQSVIKQIRMQMHAVRADHGFGDATQQYRNVASHVVPNTMSRHSHNTRKPSSDTCLNRSSSLWQEENESQIKALVEERDKLMNTGSYTLDDAVISKLNQKIQSLLVHSNETTGNKIYV